MITIQSPYKISSGALNKNVGSKAQLDMNKVTVASLLQKMETNSQDILPIVEQLKKSPAFQKIMENQNKSQQPKDDTKTADQSQQTAPVQK
jgi:hypothetical protein